MALHFFLVSLFIPIKVVGKKPETYDVALICILRLISVRYVLLGCYLIYIKVSFFSDMQIVFIFKYVNLSLENENENENERLRLRLGCHRIYNGLKCVRTDGRTQDANGHWNIIASLWKSSSLTLCFYSFFPLDNNVLLGAHEVAPSVWNLIVRIMHQLPLKCAQFYFSSSSSLYFRPPQLKPFDGYTWKWLLF